MEQHEREGREGHEGLPSFVPFASFVTFVSHAFARHRLGNSVDTEDTENGSQMVLPPFPHHPRALRVDAVKRPQRAPWNVAEARGVA